MLNEFKTFLMRGNVMDLAVGIIIGAAFTAIVNSLVGDLINPIIGLLLGGINFSDMFIDRRLAAVPAADAFWARATASYRKQSIHWVLSAKQQPTRDRRMDQLIDSCAAYLPIPAMRYGEEPAWMRKARAELGDPPPPAPA